ncbi:thioredoxin family protein, partial [Patescibacteria group bacterium]|nr:thioredoxin family protein [Patescibacteria group bacterium]
MTIKILGSGCPNCQKLENNAKQAVDELALKDIAIEHVYDIAEITEYGV